MKIIKNKFKTILIIYFSLFLFTGCHTFYEINADELKEINKNDVVKIIYTSGDTLQINYIKEVNIIENKQIEIISYSNDLINFDSTRIPLTLDGIKGVEIEKINYPISIVAAVFFSSFLFLAVLIILMENDAFQM